MPTHIALTFDIEFDINGAFAFPGKRKPRGLEALIGDSNGEDLGLTKILQILDHYGIQGTFFVEALQTAWFGPEEMGHAVSSIRARGHDIQLHLHPVWSLFKDPDWHLKAQLSPPRSATHDSLLQLSKNEMLSLIDSGLEVFSQWDLPPPTAVRTGSLFIRESAYEAFADRNLLVSSSVGLALNRPAERALQLFHAPRHFQGVLELPVTSYLGADHLLRRKTRLATIIGMGLREQRTLINAAQQRSVPFVIALSHASEFYHHSEERGFERNKLTERKLTQLCRSIQSSEMLESATISQLGGLFSEQSASEEIDKALSVPRLSSVARFMDRFRP